MWLAFKLSDYKLSDYKLSDYRFLDELVWNTGLWTNQICVNYNCYDSIICLYIISFQHFCMTLLSLPIKLHSACTSNELSPTGVLLKVLSLFILMCFLFNMSHFTDVQTSQLTQLSAPLGHMLLNTAWNVSFVQRDPTVRLLVSPTMSHVGMGHTLMPKKPKFVLRVLQAPSVPIHHYHLWNVRMVLTVEVEPQTVWSALLGIGNAAKHIQSLWSVFVPIGRNDKNVLYDGVELTCPHLREKGWVSETVH